jgi:ornithine cyclodeaminase/alanine dehydrogenase-like protein (mu-crystallin family)
MVVDTDEVLIESGDVLAAEAAGTLAGVEVQDLWEFLGTDSGSERRTLYKSIGSVEQDLGLAALVHRRCEELGLGELIDPIELTRFIG